MKLRRMHYTQDGQTKQAGKFYAVFCDYTEALRRVPLFADRKASEEMARKIERLNSIRASGGEMSGDLSKYVETMPPAIRNKLATWGILSTTRAAAGKPLADHIADWKAALLAKGNTLAYASLSANRVRKIIGGCGFKFWSDISASKLQSFLAGLRADRRKDDETVVRGMSAASYNYYQRDAKSFCKWMVRDGRASESALTHLQGVNVRTDRRHDRRALSPDELRRLLDSTAGAPERFGMSGADRALLYRLAVETGLRAGELRSLTRGSFHLGDEPSVTIAAAYAKNRRQDTLPLRAETAKLLAAHVAGKMPQAEVFAMPPRQHLAEMFRADLADARKAWLEAHQNAQDASEAAKGTFLAYSDGAGRKADFHALRHSFISNLAAGGVNPKTAQTLARHSTITLTMDRYTHLYAGDMSAALDALPDLSASIGQAQRATGTHDEAAGNSLSPSLSPKGEFRRSSVESGEV